MKKLSNTLSKTIAMMITPPTWSLSTIEITLATRRMMMRGLAKKRRKPINAPKRDSRASVFGP